MIPLYHISYQGGFALKGWPMYHDIQQRRDLGFGKSQVAEQLGLNYRTVSRYWDMTAEEFERSILSRKRRQCLELYEGIILDWLKQQPGLTGAEIWDRLKEHYDVQVSERSVRRLVGKLRKQHNIPKSISEPSNIQQLKNSQWHAKCKLIWE
jgi:transposase